MYTKCVLSVGDPSLPLSTYVDIDFTHMIKSLRLFFSLKTENKATAYPCLLVNISFDKWALVLTNCSQTICYFRLFIIQISLTHIFGIIVASQRDICYL